MGLKKFRKIRVENEDYFNLSVVCHNFVTKNKTRYVYKADIIYPKGDDRSILPPIKFDHN